MYQVDDEPELTAARCPQHSKAKRTIRINLTANTTHLVPHVDDMTELEIVTIWYERSDYDLMKQSFIPTLKKMMRGSRIEESDTETIRGLEFRTREGAMRRQHNKITAIEAVLDEQEHQLSTGEHDSEKISEVYRNNSLHCAEAARDLGEQDEYFVQMNSPRRRRRNSMTAEERPKRRGSVNTLRNMFKTVRRASMSRMSSRHLLDKLEINPANPAAA
jgi:hypothetical protein